MLKNIKERNDIYKIKRNEVGDHVVCFIDLCRVKTRLDSLLSPF